MPCQLGSLNLFIYFCGKKHIPLCFCLMLSLLNLVCQTLTIYFIVLEIIPEHSLYFDSVDLSIRPFPDLIIVCGHGYSLFLSVFVTLPLFLTLCKYDFKKYICNKNKPIFIATLLLTKSLKEQRWYIEPSFILQFLKILTLFFWVFILSAH